MSGFAPLARNVRHIAKTNSPFIFVLKGLRVGVGQTLEGQPRTVMLMPSKQWNGITTFFHLWIDFACSELVYYFTKFKLIIKNYTVIIKETVILDLFALRGTGEVELICFSATDYTILWVAFCRLRMKLRNLCRNVNFSGVDNQEVFQLRHFVKRALNFMEARNPYFQNNAGHCVARFTAQIK